MKDKTYRKSGIDIIGDIPWGTHLCQFYKTREDLTDILVPYFKAGLENNEFCMWVCWDPLRKKQAEKSLGKVLKNLNDYIAKGQIEIVDYSPQQTEKEESGFSKMKQFWIEKEALALERGFEGLRLAGNTYWLEKREWRYFKQYEEEVDSIIRNHKMLAVCPYSLDRCGASEIVDVISNHKSALIRREGKWEIIESPERRKTIEELEKSQLQYETLVQTVPDIIYEIDVDGKFIFISDSIEQLGYNSSELMGKHFREIVYPDDLENISRSIVLPKYQGKITGDEGAPKLFDERRTGKRATKALELRLIIKKQTGVSSDYCYAEIHSSGRWDRPVSENDKKLIGTLGNIGIIRDITARKRLEKDLQVSHAQMQTVIDKNPDAIIILDKEGNILFLNPVTEQMFARRKEGLLGSPFGFPLIASEAAQINIVRKSGEVGVGEMRVAEIEWSGKPAYLASIRDITELKKAEALKAEIDERTRINKLKDEFISTVSHELRTPLTTMKEFASIVSDEIPGKLTKDQREYIDIIKGNIDRLARLINNLLDISKIESGRIKPKKALADIGNLAKEAISELKPEADKKHIELKALFQTSLPNIYFDPDRIKEVFVNLITNAIKFTPNNGKVTVEIKDKNNKIECSVADTGVGIAEENLGKIFGRFQQFGRTPGPGAKGTGLGLAITKELVEMHNGKIWVESEPGKGSKFTFTLPKHTAVSIVKEAIDSGIKWAKKENAKMSLVVVSLTEINKLRQKLSSETVDSILQDMEEVLKNSLRREEGDEAIKGIGEIIVVLANCAKENSLRVEGRLEHILEEYLVRKKLSRKVNLQLSCATYPDDAQNPEKLLEKAKTL